jgi:methyl-accepting chemotaxis protein
MSWFKKTVPPTEGEGRRYERPDLLDMIEKTQAVIHFKPSGEILFANENFLTAMGYTLEEISGQHHRMFVAESYRDSPEYAQFWEKLQKGEFFSSQFMRIRKDGQPIYIQATYCPIRDHTGVIRRVIKIAMDVTLRQIAIDHIEAGLMALSDGDLTVRVAEPESEDLRALGHAFNESVSKLSSLVRKVKSVSGNVDGVTQEIISITADLSRRTETQAATLEQTAAAVEELTSTARSAAKNANEVFNVATTTRSAAEGGRTVVSSLTGAMEKIEASSEQISQIISVIENIAFQTNLLALNAGVEAARAGESGRGFAVVASEVRGLAQRSSESAMEIKTLIQSSSENVSEGSELVSRASTEFSKIFEGVNDISERIQEIANGMQEQSQTLSEINASVSHLDEVTQRNAGMVQETNNAGARLMGSAKALVTEVNFFTLAEESAMGTTEYRAIA